jgi:tetratricopeptide (TPR) repeat protein
MGGGFYNPRVEAIRRPGAWSRAQAMVLGLVPGLAHLLVLDRPGVGTAWFLLFVLGVDALAAAEFLFEESWTADLAAAGMAVASVAWLGSFLDVARLTLFRDYEKRAALRREHGGKGVRAYAAGRWGEARREFRRCLALDPRDPDALYWYGCVEARRGKVRRARRAFRRCLQYDPVDTWKWECERALAALDAAPAP